MDVCEIRKSKRTKKQISCNEDLEVDGFSGSRQENGSLKCPIISPNFTS